ILLRPIRFPGEDDIFNVASCQLGSPVTIGSLGHKARNHGLVRIRRRSDARNVWILADDNGHAEKGGGRGRDDIIGIPHKVEAQIEMPGKEESPAWMRVGAKQLVSLIPASRVTGWLDLTVRAKE